MHRFAEFLRKVLPQLTPPMAGQRLPTVEQHPKIEMVELAETPRQTLVVKRPEPPSASASYEESKRRASVGSAAPETSDSDDPEQGFMRSRVPI